jgi:hypothetical protein
MIKNRKIIFSVSVAMRDVPLFNNKEKIQEEIKQALSTHLINLYPLQMIVDNDAELELALIKKGKKNVSL